MGHEEKLTLRYLHDDMVSENLFTLPLGTNRFIQPPVHTHDDPSSCWRPDPSTIYEIVLEPQTRPAKAQTVLENQ
jgi:hypothetical protein